jgi:hypothetical protein
MAPAPELRIVRSFALTTPPRQLSACALRELGVTIQWGCCNLVAESAEHDQDLDLHHILLIG